MSNFNNYKKFENVGIRSSNDTLIVMDSSNNNISLHSSDGGDDNVDTLSIKNIINKTPNMDLNLSSLNGTTINPVITINNNHGDCRIKTNLNVSGNLNVSNNINGNISGRLYGDIYLKDGSGYIFQAGDSVDPVSRLYNTRLYNSSGQAILTVQAGSEHFNGDVSGDVTGQLNGSVYKSNGTDYVLKVDTGSAVSHLYNTRLYNSSGQAILTVQAGSEHFNGDVSSSTISVKTLEAKSGENGILTINSNTNINKNLNVLQNINCIDTITSNINLVQHNLIIPTHNNSNLLSNVKGSIYFNTTENMYEGYVGDNEGQGWQPLGGFSKTKDAVIHKNLNVIGNINLTNGEMIKTTGIGSFGSINCGVGTFTSLDASNGLIKTTGNGSFGSINCGVGTFTSLDANNGLIKTTGQGSFGSIHCGVGTFTNIYDTGLIKNRLNPLNLYGYGNMEIEAGNNGTIYLRPSNTYVVTVKKSQSPLEGRVGINNTSPSCPLDVDGDIKCTGSITTTGQGSFDSINCGVGTFTSIHSGIVGVGTSIPNSNYKLDVIGNIKCDNLSTSLQVAAAANMQIGQSNNAHLKILTDQWSTYASVFFGCYFCKNGSAGGTPYIRHATSDTSQNLASSCAISGSSDDRIKIDEELILDATNTLLKLRPQKYKKFGGKTIKEVEEAIKNYRFIISQNSEDNTSELKKYSYIIESGLIAQEIFYEVPELRFLLLHTVKESEIDETPRNFSDIKNDPDYSNWSNQISAVNYTGLIPYLIRGFQEQQTEINTLKTENQQQQTKINTLKTENTELKSIIDKLKTANSFEEFKQTF